MADILQLKGGSKAEFIFTRPRTGRTSALLIGQWQVSVGASPFSAPRSFFNALDTTQQFVTDVDYKVLASIRVFIAADFNIVELLATFSFVNNNSEESADTRFIIRDSVSGILNGSSASASSSEALGAASGAIVFRGNFTPGLHIFTLEVAVFRGPISIGGVGENGNASLYAQQMST